MGAETSRSVSPDVTDEARGEGARSASANSLAMLSSVQGSRPRAASSLGDRAPSSPSTDVAGRVSESSASSTTEPRTCAERVVPASAETNHVPAAASPRTPAIV